MPGRLGRLAASTLCLLVARMAVGLGAAASAAVVPAYTVVDLGTLGGPISQAYAINNAGQIVGNGPTRDPTAEPRGLHAFVWQASTGLQDLGPVSVYAINDRGRVAGYQVAPGGQPHAHVWELGAGGLSGGQNLGTLPGYSSSMAAGVNNLGQVVGQSYTPGAVSNPGHAFLWQAGTGLQDLGTLPGGTSSWATAINSQGQVVGASETASGQTHAFLWRAGTGLQDLGSLPGFASSVALGLNTRGQVVGWSYTSIAGPHHAFVWQAGTGMQDLGVLPGYDSNIAAGINDQGQVVGWSSVANGAPVPNRGFLWQSGTGLQDLGVLPCDAGPYTDNSPAAINNTSQIAGECNGYATLWQPAAAANPPATTASVAPLPNAAGWQRGEVTVTLSATAASGGLPVQSLTYSATGAQTIASTTVQGSTATVPITAEGSTTLSYFATDQVGTQEQSQTMTVRIDTTPPETLVQFDPTRQDLLIFGKDPGSGVPAGPIAASSVAPTSWSPDDDGDTKPDGDHSAQLRTYTLTDLAGNTTTLVLKVQLPGPHGHQLKARLVSIQYGSTPAVTFGSNSEEFHWDLAKDGTLSKLEQQVRIGTGHDQQAVEAHFEARQGHTDIRVKNPQPQPAIQKPGLDLLQIVTAKGQLSISY